MLTSWPSGQLAATFQRTHRRQNWHGTRVSFHSSFLRDLSCFSSASSASTPLAPAIDGLAKPLGGKRLFDVVAEITDDRWCRNQTAMDLRGNTRILVDASVVEFHFEYAVALVVTD